MGLGNWLAKQILNDKLSFNGRQSKVAAQIECRFDHRNRVHFKIYLSGQLKRNRQKKYILMRTRASIDNSHKHYTRRTTINHHFRAAIFTFPMRTTITSLYIQSTFSGKVNLCCLFIFFFSYCVCFHFACIEIKLI